MGAGDEYELQLQFYLTIYNDYALPTRQTLTIIAVFLSVFSNLSESLSSAVIV